MDCEGLLEESGADLKTGCSVCDSRCRAKRLHVETNAGIVEADVVITILGFKPNTEVAELQKATNGALLVNEYGATEDAYIHAVGDCAVVHHVALGKPVYVPHNHINKQARMMADKLGSAYMSGFLGSASCLKVLDLRTGMYRVSEPIMKAWFGRKSINYFRQEPTDYYPNEKTQVIGFTLNPMFLLGGEDRGEKNSWQNQHTSCCYHCENDHSTARLYGLLLCATIRTDLGYSACGSRRH